MIILDTNVWVARFNSADSLHLKAREVFDNLKEQIMIPEYVLLEVLNIFIRKMSKKDLDQFIGNLLVSDDFVIAPNASELFNELLNNFILSENNKLSFVDHSLLYLSRHHKVISFDKELNKSIINHQK